MKLLLLFTAGILGILVFFIGFVATFDHRTDRNVPGSITGAGRAAITDTQGTFKDEGIRPRPGP